MAYKNRKDESDQNEPNLINSIQIQYNDDSVDILRYKVDADYLASFTSTYNFVNSEDQKIKCQKIWCFYETGKLKNHTVKMNHRTVFN